MHWYVVHSKPRQEQVALENLQRQGYECFLPMTPSEKLRQGSVTVVLEPLFPRYLFIRLDVTESGKSWGPIRSTRGVSRLVTFGSEPARIDDRLVNMVRARNGAATRPRPLFVAGERVTVTEGPFAGIEAIYQMSDGERRAMVLIELLSKPVQMSVPAGGLRKAG